MENKDKIDTDLYSRQIGTFGMETMGKLIKMNVVIMGMRGEGVEIAKNLILAGPKSVTLYDPETTAIRDLGANFYLEEKHVGKTSRADASFAKLQELNPYVKVEVLKTEADLHAAIASGNVHVICQTEMIINGVVHDPKEVNDECRKSKVGYISTQTFGPWGYAFVDYGKDHTVTDHDGEAIKSYIVTMIQKGEKTIVTCHEDKRHIYQPGDYVIFREVEGMTQLNETKPIKVLDTTVYTLTLEVDSRQFSDYVRQGVVENVKVAKQISFHSWEESYANPAASSPEGMLPIPDLGKFGRSDQLHASLFGIHQFVKANKRYPTSADVGACMDLATAQLKNGNGIEVEIEKETFEKAVANAGSSISPMAAFFGGIVAQEIVKYTGKYSPLKQWLHFDIYETLPRQEVNKAPMNCRYDDQIAIYGREVQEMLGKVHLFMVGAGALGCELIKAYALMGIGCSTKGKVHCTDNDNIEISNLNRQFLFRKGNVGASKSETACKIAKGINNTLNVKDYMTRVGSDTEALFNDPFWESLDFVVNAVDNINARLYVDSKCVWYEKPLLESGTLGTKANSQMIVPHKT
jgi:ubiquitin-activating enzyme E1